jgi:hypothetical protein
MAEGELEDEEEEARAPAHPRSYTHTRTQHAHLAGGADACVFFVRAQDVDGDDIRIEEFDGPLREWIAQAKVERQIKKRFARFLNNFPTGETAKVYPRRINDLCASASPAFALHTHALFSLPCVLPHALSRSLPPAPRLTHPAQTTSRAWRCRTFT